MTLNPDLFCLPNDRQMIRIDEAKGESELTRTPNLVLTGALYSAALCRFLTQHTCHRGRGSSSSS